MSEISNLFLAKWGCKGQLTGAGAARLTATQRDTIPAMGLFIVSVGYECRCWSWKTDSSCHCSGSQTLMNSQTVESAHQPEPVYPTEVTALTYHGQLEGYRDTQS
jgi:hypothetical protein